MPEQPPRTPFTPMYAPELSRNTNGNILYRDAQGHWLPYNGPLPNQLQAMPEHAIQQLGHVPLNAGPIPIDPALLPLPGGPDLDLRDGPTIANAISLKHTEKVGGSRRKGKERADPKGKKRQHASSGSDNDSEPVAKCGHPHGSPNYGKDNVCKMFDLIVELLPMGQKGWKEVERWYKKWAKQNGRAERPPKALENKYKQYLRQKKPTGSASCPPEVKHPHEIEDLINQRIGTRELSNSEFDDRSENGLSDEDIEVVEHTAIARRAPTPPLPRKSRARGTELASKLAHAFDPEVQRDRDEAHTCRSLENTQILTLSQQLRDERATTENLHGENTILRNQIHDVERALERAELRNEMMGFASPAIHALRVTVPTSAMWGSRVNGKICCETIYPEGDPSTDEYDEDDDNEENCNPWHTFDVPRRSRSHHMSSRHPISRRHTPSAGPSHRHMSRRCTPTPGPSRLPALLPSPSPPPAHIPIPSQANTFGTRAPTSVVGGDAVELVVTPRRGPAVVLIVSLTKQLNTYMNN
ncbi:hypothetical protein K438DRAFT_2166707 [Mycena galopus ATCC 62051]|nr:hypothetical protein K438DRAFT_2166707 [Mycena galopus ATCC 62051]